MGDNQILAMKRLYIFEPRSFEIEKLKRLHKNSFVHRQVKRKTGYGGSQFENVVFTAEGIRLIDVGISGIKEKAGENLFNKYIESELKEAGEYYSFIMEV